VGKIRSSLKAIGQNWSMTQAVFRFLWAEVLGIFLGVIVIVAVPVAFFVNWLPRATGCHLLVQQAGDAGGIFPY